MQTAPKGIAACRNTAKHKTKRPQSYDWGLLVKEGEGKESPILYAQPPLPTIRQRSLPTIATVLARRYDDGMVVQK
jgi:hypothetical protein